MEELQMEELNASQTRIPTSVFNEIVFNGGVACVKRRDGVKIYLVSSSDMTSLTRLKAARRNKKIATDNKKGVDGEH